MQIAIHLGAHCTDEDRLLRTLLQNKDVLAKEKIAVPGPGRYRATIGEAIEKLRGDAASKDAQEILIDGMLDDDEAERIVLTHESFLCVPSMVFDKGMLYERAGYKPMWIRNLFRDQKVEFFLALRNPATFVPAVFHHRGQKTERFNEFLNRTDIEQIRWSDVVLAIRECTPDAPLTVWCNEDTPLIWPEVIRAVSNHPPETRVMGGMNILAQIIRREGLRRLRGYLADHPPKNETHRRRIVAAFLEKYAIDDEVEQVIDVPGWTDELVADLTRTYEEDLEEIRNLPGVTFIEA